MLSRHKVSILFKKTIPVFLLVIFIIFEVFVSVCILGGIIYMVINEKCIVKEVAVYTKLVNALRLSFDLHIIPFVLTGIQFIFKRKFSLVMLTISAMTFIIFALELFYSK